MSVSAHDVAREIRNRVPGAGAMKVHKFLYYCQGWFATWTGQPMFHEPIEAWDQGPVVADLWRWENRGAAPPPPRVLANEMQVAVDYVLHRYGGLSGRDLSELTHRESPWRHAHERGRNAEIGLDDLVAYFASDDDEALRRSRAAELLSRVDANALIEAPSRTRDRTHVDESDSLRGLLHSPAG